MRGVTAVDQRVGQRVGISTHTPHARRDLISRDELDSMGISTHTPHARRDKPTYKKWGRAYTFLLTRLMRGVTLTVDGIYGRLTISTHTPHARRDKWEQIIDCNFDISTHTPHARRDHSACRAGTAHCHFYSHASCEA